MQIPRVEDMVTHAPEDSPGKNKTILQKKTGRQSDNTLAALFRVLPFLNFLKMNLTSTPYRTCIPHEFHPLGQEHRLTENVRPGDLEDQVIFLRVENVVTKRASQ